MKKLQFLVPQYNEDDSIIKPLLDSIAIQQNIDFDEIGVTIVNDGSDVRLTDSFLKSYPFEITYLLKEHEGVSAARQYAFDHSKSEYVMFCDIDDMMFSPIGLFLIFKEIEEKHFDSMVSVFVEEGRIPGTNEVTYLDRGRMEQGGIDSTFVHGKVHKRKYLVNQKIRWNKDLTIHEDSYFNILCQNLSQNVIYCPTAFYLWKWRDESVCRRDPKYILKTMPNMIASNTALIKEFLNRNFREKAQFFTTSMVYDCYQTMNKKEWIDQENQEYRHTTEICFKNYWSNFKYLFDETPEPIKNQIYAGMKNRFMMEGVFAEEITFKTWITSIENLK